MQKLSLRARLLLAAALAGLAAAAGCTWPFPSPFQVCTMADCRDAMFFTLEGPIPDEFSLEVYLDGGEILSVRCTGGKSVTTQEGLSGLCTQDGVQFFTSPEPGHAILTWEGLRVETDFIPEIVSSRPNGPGCPPECQIGLVTLSFDADG